MINKQSTPRDRRKFRIRKKLSGTSSRPRLTVTRSNKHLSLQAVDDVAGNTLVSAQTVEKDVKSKLLNNNKGVAVGLAVLFAERAKAKGITEMVFDRNGYAYHGRIKTIADKLREDGIKI